MATVDVTAGAPLSSPWFSSITYLPFVRMPATTPVGLPAGQKQCNASYLACCSGREHGSVAVVVVFEARIRRAISRNKMMSCSCLMVPAEKTDVDGDHADGWERRASEGRSRDGPRRERSRADSYCCSSRLAFAKMLQPPVRSPLVLILLLLALPAATIVVVSSFSVAPVAVGTTRAGNKNVGRNAAKESSATRIRSRRRFSASTSSSSAAETSATSSLVDEQIQIGRDAFSRYYNFPLDDWQLQAGGAIVQGRHVVTCSPTGSGKTVIGEMALLHAYHNLGSKSIYTTPLKALSNQKYSDLVGMFGRNHTGLATGDISINRENGRVTVMTTEVYRNLAWRWHSTSSSASLSAEARRRAVDVDRSLEDTSVVVLDEFHYMGLPGRGGVWEESVITSPPHMQIVALSATLPNAIELTRWMQDVTGQSVILINVPSDHRPVPLRYLYATKDGLYPLFRDPDAGPGAPKGLLGWRDEDGGGDDTAGKKKKGNLGFGGGAGAGPKSDRDSKKIPRGLQVNPALKAANEKRMQRVNRALERQKLQQQKNRYDDDDDELNWQRSRPVYRRLSPREERKERERLLRREMRRAVPSMLTVVQRLRQKDLLPAIFFIFSRARCDEAARTVYQQMKGPRDPTTLLPEELEELGETREGEQATSENQRKKRKTRQRGRSRGDLLEDADGRTFRSKNSYISEDLLQSLYEAGDRSFDDSDFDSDENASPLSTENWDFYSKAGLLGYNQIREVAGRIALFNRENPEIAFDDEISEQYLFGVGSHHAGMLPAHKSFVEILYKHQLMKVVFATETLAAGINMPARTTVICSLAKRGDGSSMNLLETSNLLRKFNIQYKPTILHSGRPN